ncbi:hypothetical protein GCM10027284_04550 [Cyclobacterium sediminis]
MNKTIKILLLILLILGLLTIVLTFINFWINGHIHWFSEVDKEYFGIFGDFIGGVSGTIFTIVATIIVWLTYNSQREELKQTRNLLIKQLELSYKPDLFVKDTQIYIYGIVKDKMLCPNLFTNTKEYSEGIRSDAFAELINVGGEISKRTNCYWECDIEKIKHFFDENFPDTVKVSFGPENKFIKYNSLDGSSITGPFHMISMNHTIDFVLPYKTNETVVKIRMPNLYIEWFMSSIILEDFARKKVFNDMFNPVEFPKLFLNVSFKDILGETREKRFLVEIKFQSGIRIKSEKEEDQNKVLDITTMQVEFKEQRNHE